LSAGFNGNERKSCGNSDTGYHNSHGQSFPSKRSRHPATQLDEAHIAGLPAQIGRPSCRRAEVKTGIVHFGPEAFHRAHQAATFVALLAHDPRWSATAWPP
jgi:hypothetical protein